MFTQTLYILLCLGILFAVNGCYVEAYPDGYYAPRSYYVYPQPYIYAYPQPYIYRYSPYRGYRHPYRYYAPY